MAKRKMKTRSWLGVGVVALVATGLVVAVVISATGNEARDRDVRSFQDCKDASGQVAESYPEQCYYGGKSFINSQQATSYEGLTEKDAREKAIREGKTARVVERDDEALPVTMDLADGRLNLYVRDDKVYKVKVESID